MGDFARCLAITLREEGGFFDHPKDPGGTTNFGVIQRVYNKYRAARGLEQQTVGVISSAEVKDIYARYYWNPLNADELNPGVDLAVFDFGVNSGISRSTKYLQRICGVKVDGLMGPVTIDAANSKDPDWLIKRIHDERLAFVNRIPYKKYFIKGWTRRIKRVREDSHEFAEAFATNSPTQPPAKVVITQTGDPPLPKAQRNGGEPKKTVMSSKTWWSSVFGAGASVAVGVESVGSTAQTVNTNVGQVVQTTESVTKMADTLVAALQNPIFLLACGGIIFATYIAFERSRKVKDLED